MIELPFEAGEFESGPFEPDDEWLASAPKELQIAAMRRWFVERYEDPANEPPWDGEDKEYVFVWGGPYDPNNEIQDRFGTIVDFETLRELIEDLWRNVGDKWAPIHHEGAGYNDYISHLAVMRAMAISLSRSRSRSGSWLATFGQQTICATTCFPSSTISLQMLRPLSGGKTK